MCEIKRKPVAPNIDQWVWCPDCGYEGILELATQLPHEDNWMPKFCPNCGQEFLYDDSWRDENGRLCMEVQIPFKHVPSTSFTHEEIEAIKTVVTLAECCCAEDQAAVDLVHKMIKRIQV